MTRAVLAVLLVLVFGQATALAADSYEDFARGISAVNQGDSDQAIALLSSALAGGDLDPHLVPVAYLERARAFLAKQQCAPAVSDLSAALKLKPDYAEAYVYSGFANDCAGDAAAAMADFSKVIEALPNAAIFFARGRARWNEGDFAGAAADFAEASKRETRWAYPVLWFAIATMREGTFDAGRMKDLLDDVEDSDWPAPLLAVFEGSRKPEDAFAAADKDPKSQSDRRCEADFYLGEWWLGQKNVEVARPLLLQAQSHCRHDFIEYAAANVELKRLK